MGKRVSALDAGVLKTGGANVWRTPEQSRTGEGCSKGGRENEGWIRTGRAGGRACGLKGAVERLPSREPRTGKLDQMQRVPETLRGASPRGSPAPGFPTRRRPRSRPLAPPGGHHRKHLCPDAGASQPDGSQRVSHLHHPPQPLSSALRCGGMKGQESLPSPSNTHPLN